MVMHTCVLIMLSLHFPVIGTSCIRNKIYYTVLHGLQSWHKWYCARNLVGCFSPNIFFFLHLYMLLCVNLSHLIWLLHSISQYQWGPFHLSILQKWTLKFTSIFLSSQMTHHWTFLYTYPSTFCYTFSGHIQTQRGINGS